MRSALPARTTVLLHVRLLVAVLVAAVLFASSAQADTGPSFANVCDQPSRVGYAGCFAIKSTVVSPQRADVAEHDAVRLRAGRPAVGVLAAQQRRRRRDGRHRRRLRRPERRVRPEHVPVPVRPAGVHHRQRLLHEGQPERGHDLPGRRSGWASEISLDLDMVSATCPNCHILLVEASDNSMLNLGTAVDEAVALGAKYVSNSYGGSEWSGGDELRLLLRPPGRRRHGQRRRQRLRRGVSRPRHRT